jgi:hypothetical protein
MAKPTIIEAVQNPKLLRPVFRDLSTWSAWICLLKALFGLPLSGKGLALYQQCTQRTTLPEGEFSELFVVAGRRSGKSFISAIVACYLGLFFDYQPFLGPGERGSIVIIAADRQQARVIFNYVSGILNNNPIFRGCIANETRERIELSNQIDIEIMTASFRTIRGRTIVAALLDEICFWMAEGSNPDVEIFRAIRPSMMTIPNSKLIAISSPYAKRGVMFEEYEKHFGCDDSSRTLVWQASSTVMNPSLDRDFIAAEIARDPSSGRAEYEALWREDIETFLPLEAIQAVVVPGLHSLPPQDQFQYSCFTDPSGGRVDQFSMCVGHIEREKIVVDQIRGWRPPLDPSEIVGEVKKICTQYRVARVMGDRYGAAWVSSAFEKIGLRYEVCPLVKSDLYLALEGIINMRRVELPDNKQLISELRNLERRRGPSGKDKIDHPPRGSDDLANAVAGLATMLNKEKPSMRLLLGFLEIDGNYTSHRTELTETNQI